MMTMFLTVKIHFHVLTRQQVLKKIQIKVSANLKKKTKKQEKFTCRYKKQIRFLSLGGSVMLLSVSC